MYCDRLLVPAHGRAVAEGASGDVLTAGLIKRVYGVDAEVTTADGHPAIRFRRRSGGCPVGRVRRAGGRHRCVRRDTAGHPAGPARLAGARQALEGLNEIGESKLRRTGRQSSLRVVTRRADASGAGNGQSMRSGPSPPLPSREGRAFSQHFTAHRDTGSQHTGSQHTGTPAVTRRRVERAVLADGAHRAGGDAQLAVRAGAVAQLLPVTR
ncbi:hypothetical protein GCM10010339_55760 [Streptomyces alanosinicus]|uniref:ABC transporter ATP-binding protein n=1 Tax=Streptomyces alanosinicus TaxID=68171 RepID=A0A919D3V5_9ACTN|nr:hypothetical protein GCM10010339_55760 [Streptomyces alanosinicus]